MVIRIANKDIAHTDLTALVVIRKFMAKLLLDLLIRGILFSFSIAYREVSESDMESQWGSKESSETTVMIRF